MSTYIHFVWNLCLYKLDILCVHTYRSFFFSYFKQFNKYKKHNVVIVAQHVNEQTIAQYTVKELP